MLGQPVKPRPDPLLVFRAAEASGPQELFAKTSKTNSATQFGESLENFFSLFLFFFFAARF